MRDDHELLGAALNAYHSARHDKMRAAIAAVAPLIAKAERERCATMTDGLGAAIQNQAKNPMEQLFGRMFCEHAAAIRALPDA